MQGWRCAPWELSGQEEAAGLCLACSGLFQDILQTLLCAESRESKWCVGKGRL